MRIRTISLVLLAVMVVTFAAVPISAALNWEVVQNCSANLSFQDTAAKCLVKVVASEQDAEIIATIKLQKKGLLGIYTTKKTWEDVTATGTLVFSETFSPVDSGEYQLVVDIQVIGNEASDTISKKITAVKS